MTAFLFTKMLTYERANELLRYDPGVGKIYWKVRRCGVRLGGEAGGLASRQRVVYRNIGIDGQLYLTHRIVWLLHYGVWPKGMIDHLNGNGIDNRVENLRDTTNQENQKNRRMHLNNTSGITGVSWKSGKWLAQITINGKQNHIGCFDDKDKAAEAYRKAADKIGCTERHGLAV